MSPEIGVRGDIHSNLLLANFLILYMRCYPLKLTWFSPWPISTGVNEVASTYSSICATLVVVPDLLRLLRS